jgi:hypothetical protein
VKFNGGLTNIFMDLAAVSNEPFFHGDHDNDNYLKYVLL